MEGGNKEKEKSDGGHAERHQRKRSGKNTITREIMDAINRSIGPFRVDFFDLSLRSCLVLSDDVLQDIVPSQKYFFFGTQEDM